MQADKTTIGVGTIFFCNDASNIHISPYFMKEETQLLSE